MATEQTSLADHQYCAETRGQSGGAVAAHRLADREGRRAFENITLHRQLRVLLHSRFNYARSDGVGALRLRLPRGPAGPRR